MKKEAVPLNRYTMVQALGSTGNPQAVDPVISALEDKDESVRTAAVISLEWLGDSRAWPLLAAKISDPSARVRSRVIRTLGRFAYKEARELIVTTLAMDSDADVRGSAAEVLGQSGDRSALDPVRAALRDPDPGVKALAEEAIRQLEQ